MESGNVLPRDALRKLVREASKLRAACAARGGGLVVGEDDSEAEAALRQAASASAANAILAALDEGGTNGTGAGGAHTRDTGC